LSTLSRATRPQIALLVAAVATALLALPSAASAELFKAGQLDPRFGDDGVASLGLAPATLRDVAVYPTGPLAGEIVAVGNGVATADGSGENAGLLVRLNADGSPDQDFGGGDGVVAVPNPAGPAQSNLLRVEIDPVGRLVVLTSFGLARFTSEGELDPSFGGCGCGYTVVAPPTEPWGFSLGHAGQAFYVRSSSTSTATPGEGGSRRFVHVGALTVNGEADWERKVSLDTNPDTYPVGWDDFSPAVTTDSDGRLLVAGTHQRLNSGSNSTCGTSTDFGAVRLFANGTLDPSFGTGGGTNVNMDAPTGVCRGTWSMVKEVATDADGGAIISGRSERPADDRLGGHRALRLTSDGTPDAGFGDGSGRVALSSSGGGVDDLFSALVDDAGRVYLGAGVDRFYNSFDAGAWRLLPDGTGDPGFSDDGQTQLEPDAPDHPSGGNGRSNTGGGIALTDDGLLLAGSSGGQSHLPPGAIVARFLTEDTEIDTGGTDGGGDDQGEGGVAGGVAAKGVTIHKISVPKSAGKLIRRGVRVLASCPADCTIVVDVTVNSRVAARMHLKSLRFAHGSATAKARQKKWVIAPLTASAANAVSTYGGGGRLQIRVRSAGTGAQPAAEAVAG
jgi:uncharacterized delta-60 repeat protein